MRMMRWWAMALVAGVLAGCGTVKSVRFDDMVTVQEGALAFRLVDERPADRQTTSVTQESYGEVALLGDDAVHPPAPRLLAGRLHAEFGERLRGRTVVLQDFVVHLVDPSVEPDARQLEKNLSAVETPRALAVPLAGLVYRGIGTTTSAKTVTVRVAGTLDGQAFAGRADARFKGRATQSDIRQVLDAALKATLSDIARVAGPSQDQRAERRGGS